MIRFILPLLPFVLADKPPAEQSSGYIPYEFERLELENGVCPADRSVDCLIIAPPTPAYPLISTPVETDCTATIKLLETGLIDVISVECDDSRFVQTTIEGFDTVRWMPTNACGQPCYNVDRVIDYPIQYRLDR